ncbi:Xaa-Pro peptidase family protein [Aestuariicoccus sp. MJ-SS9]|uniref:Xaa-Pro peptidase family protein n=1 Tax=Aestuariicoccus sp. MJ-SS9 TaxID=3079855 RepID=UPI0029091F65|nr:Xaa-Pro peptidase family protein [Aestuariicoccus sp. MJ-SS9]MDU8910404.1 Xaa-Pro peptidase family protein [Aestuariicoccus sp. MJ-SS9]
MTLPPGEYADRRQRAQALMAKAGLAALLLTTEPEVRYFTGYLTRFWESPTRPWFLILPASGAPVAVIPAIGAPLMRRSGVEDIRSWNAPDLTDDGIGLLTDTLRELTGTNGAIGLPMGHETHLRMPLADFRRLGDTLGPSRLTDDRGILRRLRMVKSEAEIALIREACGIADRAFARVPQIARAGVGLDRVFRDFQRLCLDEGADFVPYLAGAAETGGYADVISPATATPLAAGDVLMLDTGLTRQGYFCDFDRNYSVGPPTAEVAAAHARLIDATRAGFDAARPGASAADLFHAMAAVCGAGPEDGRLGHGLGMQLTEWPSLIPGDHTVLEPGMVLTLEPFVRTGPGRLMVHEENIVIRDARAEWLSTPATAAIPVLEA